MTSKNTGYFSVFWTLLVLLLCAFPGEQIPDFNWMKLLALDKWIHAFLFLIFSFTYASFFLLQARFISLKNHAKLLSLLISITYGCLLEYLQFKVFSQRNGDWGDVLANSFGSAMGVVFYKKLAGLLKKIKTLNSY